MQEQQNKFLIDADIGDDDVTLPSLPAVNVPIIENNKVEIPKTESTQADSQEQQIEATEEKAKGGFFSRMKEGLSKSRKSFADGMVNILIGGKEIDDELLEEVEEQLLVADIGVEATKPLLRI